MTSLAPAGLLELSKGGALSHFRAREQLISELARVGSITQAVETGTWRGDTTRILRGLFPNVATIELLPDIHAAAKTRNADLKDVEFLLGDSGDVLRDLASARGAETTLFYLDAHAGSFYTPEATRPRTSSDPAVPGGTNTQCPLMAELAAIDTWSGAGAACLLIDDARVFLGPHPGFRHSDWPSFIDVVDRLRSVHPRFVTVLDDMIIAVPPSQRQTVEAWWLATAVKKRRQGHSEPSSVRQAFRALVRATAKSVRARLMSRG